MQFCQTEQSSTVAVQESCNELNELRADYNRQLEEQVGLARIDIMNALQEQIEVVVACMLIAYIVTIIKLVLVTKLYRIIYIIHLIK